MGASGPDGCLYCAPCDSDKVLVIDPAKRTLDYILGARSGYCKYSGIALGPDDCLYCAPWDSENVLVIDPVKRTLDHISGARDRSYHGIALGPDGCLYCPPKIA